MPQFPRWLNILRKSSNKQNLLITDIHVSSGECFIVLDQKNTKHTQVQCSFPLFSRQPNK